MKHLFRLCLLAFVLGASAAHAESRALIIGVAGYDDPNIPDLLGPTNDALLMRDVLATSGFSDITLLGDMNEADGRPTRAVILDGFSGLAARARQGDQVYIHLSGHGSRQLDPEGDETDGLDEIFLPADTAIAEAGSGLVPNAITDDEIGSLLAEIQSTGADVFFVMDSCHSGSGTRAFARGVADRQVSPALLGIDLAAARAGGSVRSVDSGPDAVGQAEGSGRLIAFYATRSNDVAREVDMSNGTVADDSEWFGLFTAAIASRLESGQTLTYRQLFQSVLSELNSGSGFGMGAVQTPLWEGDMIDEPVFGKEGRAGPTRFLVDGDAVDAGRLHGLEEGTLLALVADISDPQDAVLGYAQVEAVEPRRAFLRPVADDCVPEAGTLCAFAGGLPEAARFAQVELSPVTLTIAFSPVFDAETGQPLSPDAPESGMVAAALEDASARTGIGAEFPAEIFDVQIALSQNTLWFGPAATIDGAPAGLAFGLAEDEPRLVQLLGRVLRAERLARTLDALGEEASPFNPSPVAVDVERNASPIEALSKPGARVDPRRECQAALRSMRETGFAPLQGMDDLKQCDLLRFRAAGERDGQRDVNRIHIDAQYCVNVDYELVEGDQALRDLGDPMVMCSDCPGPVPYSAGYERLYVLVSELEENAEALNLSGVLENCTGREGTRSAAASALSGVLEDAARRGRTRGSMGLGGALSDVWVDRYAWRVLPRASVFARGEGGTP
ncbi:caspase family protein [Martelella radicis]|uniref:Peptidase C14 caspase domain-containing protein n=1 Tax=Martelella radicis TaxID=1397476 RepID=A0A7W6P7K6_9HYPH|nr:caspase family protein [Martelella radicis]MBB4120277.1 hypothetical protein [Martelella radicis]